MTNSEQKSHRSTFISMIALVFIISISFQRQATRSRWFLPRKEISGVFQANDDYSIQGGYVNYRYGKYFFVTDDGQRIAVRDHYLSDIKNGEGKTMWQRDNHSQRGYPLHFESKSIVHGVYFSIQDLQEKAEKEGKTLSYPESADALLDLETITWLEK